MSIDVIIPVYRPTEKLKKMLLAIQKQTCRAEHIFLMHTKDGYDLTWAETIGTTIPVIEIPVCQEAFDHGGTRDRGMRISKADIVILMTQDAIPVNASVFEELIKTLVSDCKVAVSYARQVPEKNCGILETYTRIFNYPKESVIKSQKDMEKMGIKTYFCSNVCAAYNRETYLKLGGFETDIIFNEDMVFAAKAIKENYKIAYEADAIVMHAHDYTGKQLVKRNFDMGVSQACYPEIFANVKSEKEGIKLIKQTAFYLIKRGKPFKIVELFLKSGCKYIGYQLGKHYTSLPEVVIDKLTMNPAYWKRRRCRE